MSKKIYCLLFVLALAGRLEAEDGPVEPYVAYVAREGEFARCGPSEEYYKTDPLRAGAEVEVYLETEDGWLGIRPPSDSFCWLQSDQVEVADDETQGTVIEPSTVAWIGTHLGKARQYRWQVRLDEGEQVTIIGTAQREGPEGEEVWYRIVPPAGEFRWVQRSQVSDSLDKVVYGDPLKADGPEERYAAADDRPRAQKQGSQNDGSQKDRSPKATQNSTASGPRRAAESAAEDGVAALMEDAPVGSGLARLDNDVQIRSIAENDRPAANDRPGPPTEPAAEQDVDWVSGSRVVTASATESPAAPLQPTAPPRLQPLPGPVTLAPSGYRPSANLDSTDLDSLRLELSHAMAAGAHADEVEPLRAHIAQLTTHASESVIRGRASLLLRRIEEYQRVAQQRDGRGSGAAAAPTIPSTAMRSPSVGSPSVGSTANPASLPQNPAPMGIGAPTIPGQSTTFDGQGWLVRVYSARPDAPPYAITDSAGRTLSYITPSAGINLRRYLNQEVGLYGRVAYDTSLETPHLIAEQAVRLRTR